MRKIISILTLSYIKFTSLQQLSDHLTIYSLVLSYFILSLLFPSFWEDDADRARLQSPSDFLAY